MDSKLFKILLFCLIIVLFTVWAIGYEQNLFRNILIGVFVFAFLLASYEAITNDDDTNY